MYALHEGGSIPVVDPTAADGVFALMWLVIALPLAETIRRWKETTPQWPIMHAVTYVVTRDLMMARHQANHIQVAYANSAAAADLAIFDPIHFFLRPIRADFSIQEWPQGGKGGTNRIHGFARLTGYRDRGEDGLHFHSYHGSIGVVKFLRVKLDRAKPAVMPVVLPANQHDRQRSE